MGFTYQERKENRSNYLSVMFIDAGTTGDDTNTSWILDSGADHHLISDGC